MTTPASLLCALFAAGPGFGEAPPPRAYPPPLTGITAAADPPLIRAQSPPPPGWGPDLTVPVGPQTGRPFAPPPPDLAAPLIGETYGVNGPRPFDAAPELYFDAGHIFAASADGRPDNLAVTELDFRYEVDVPAVAGGAFTFAPEYRLRTLSGPASNPGQPSLPGNLHRLGADFALTTRRLGPWSATVGLTPSINTDFTDSLTDLGTQYDGRAALFYQAAPDLTLVGGVKYYDRVDDLLLPWAGAVWRPGDRWEVRAVFPDPRVEYFWGPVLGKPMWVYGGFEYRREAWQFDPDTPGLPEVDAVQFSDWRLILGARKEQGWGRTFLEAGLVFDREVEFARSTGADFDVGESLILRGGVRF